MNTSPINFVKCRIQNIWIQKLIGNLLEGEWWKTTSDMKNKIWPLADVFSSSLIGWLNREN